MEYLIRHGRNPVYVISAVIDICDITESSRRNLCNGLFTLGQAQGTGPQAVGPTEMFTLVRDRERNQDPLVPIVLFHSPSPSPVAMQCE